MKTIRIFGTLLSAIIGFAFCWMPWGEGSFHGSGFPVPIVIWDKGVDYIGFAGFLINPLLMVVLFWLGVGAACLIRRWKSKPPRSSGKG